MMTYVLDTNTVTAVLKKDAQVVTRLRSVLASDSRVLVSAVVYYEITRGLLWRDAIGLLAAFDRLVASLEWLDVTRTHWSLAAGLWAESRRSGATLDDADLILAAQARDEQAILVTDDKDFDLIDVARENWVIRREPPGDRGN